MSGFELRMMELWRLEETTGVVWIDRWMCVSLFLAWKVDGSREEDKYG